MVIPSAQGTLHLELESSATEQEQETNEEPATPQIETKTGAADNRNDHGDELTCRAGVQPNSPPLARVKLICSVKVPPCQRALVDVHTHGMLGMVRLEPTRKKMGSLQIGESLHDFTDDSMAGLAATNHGHVTRVLRKGATLGEAFSINTVDPKDMLGDNPKMFTHKSVLMLILSCEPEDQSSWDSLALFPGLRRKREAWYTLHGCLCACAKKPVYFPYITL